MEQIHIDESQEEISFRFPPPERSGQIVIKVEDLGKHYGKHKVFEMIDYEVERGDKIAVVGPNGAGKSTFIRILAGMEPYQKGKVETGYKDTTEYIAQHQAEELKPAKTNHKKKKTHHTSAPK